MARANEALVRDVHAAFGGARVFHVEGGADPSDRFASDDFWS